MTQSDARTAPGRGRIRSRICKSGGRITGDDKGSNKTQTACWRLAAFGSQLAACSEFGLSRRPQADGSQPPASSLQFTQPVELTQLAVLSNFTGCSVRGLGGVFVPWHRSVNQH